MLPSTHTDVAATARPWVSAPDATTPMLGNRRARGSLLSIAASSGGIDNGEPKNPKHPSASPRAVDHPKSINIDHQKQKQHHRGIISRLYNRPAQGHRRFVPICRVYRPCSRALLRKPSRMGTSGGWPFAGSPASQTNGGVSGRSGRDGLMSGPEKGRCRSAAGGSGERRDGCERGDA